MQNFLANTRAIPREAPKKTTYSLWLLTYTYNRGVRAFHGEIDILGRSCSGWRAGTLPDQWWGRGYGAASQGGSELELPPKEDEIHPSTFKQERQEDEVLVESRNVGASVPGTYTTPPLAESSIPRNGPTDRQSHTPMEKVPVMFSGVFSFRKR